MADAATTKQVVQRPHRRHAALQPQVWTFLQQHLQPTLQSTVAVALCCILVFVKSVTFPLACLSGVFVVVLHVLLVRDHHVGTLLLSSAGLLGAVWLGVLSAGVLVTITLQGRSPAVHLTLLVVLSSIGFGIFGIIKVTPLPFRLMLQGTNLMMTFGMGVVLSLFAPTVRVLWSYFMSYMLLAFAAAALASCVSAIIVLPSFATEDAMEHVITALRKAGQTSSMCISILLRPKSDDEPGGQLSDRQNHQAAAVPTNSNSSQPGLTQPVATADSSGRSTAMSLNRQGSLHVEDLGYLEAHPSTELHSFQHDTQPGVWGLQSFVKAHSATSAAAQRQQQLAGHAAAAAAAAAAAVMTSDEQVSDGNDNASVEELAAAADEDVVVDLHTLTTSTRGSSSGSSNAHHDDKIIQGSLVRITRQPPATGSSKSIIRRKHHLGLNSLSQVLHHDYKHHHNQQQQQSAVQQQQHLLNRLGRGVDLIRPLLLETRLMHEAVAVEQSWWVRLAVGGLPLPPEVNIHNWSNLVNALEALLDRVAALEGMLEGGPDHASLSSLDSYTTMRQTCGVIFAQAAALCASLAAALQARLQQQQQQQQQQQLLHKLIAFCCSKRSIGGGSSSSSNGSCPMLGICWEASKQQLLDVLHYETECYFSRLAAASQQRPFKLDPARAMVAVMFLSTLSLGVIEAAQKLQAAGQVIVYGKTAAAAAAVTAAAAAERSANVPRRNVTAAAAAAAVPAGDVNLQALYNQPPKAAESAAAAAAAARSARQTPAASSNSSSRFLSSSTGVLLDSLLCVSVFRRLKVVLLQELPRNITSAKAFTAMLQARRFQAGFKLWLVSSVAVAAAAVISVVWSELPPNVLMFGFMAIVFTMKERVESSTEMVNIRVGSTVVGAGLGHLLMFHPALANQPWGLTAVLLFCAFVLPAFTAGQFRMMLCLLLITLNSMVLCQYVGCCDATGDLVYLLGRIIATGGGALFAMLINRLFLPWRRDQWALEEMSKVLGLAVTAADVMYQQEFYFVAGITGHDRMQHSFGRYDSRCDGRDQDQDQDHDDLDHVKITVLPDDQQQQQPEAVRPVGPSAAAAAAAADFGNLFPKNTDDSRQQQCKASSHQDRISDQRQQQLQCSESQQQLALMQSLLTPVSLAIQRDTWMRWKWGSLAIPPVVHLMLSAIQQLSDALAALKATLSQICDITPHHTTSLACPPPQWQQQPPGSSSSNRLIHASDHSHTADDWRSVLLFDEFAGLVHADIQKLFNKFQFLVPMVQQQIRKPTSDKQAALKRKIAEIHKLRIAISIRYVQLRNARHKNFRQWMTMQQQQQQQNLRTDNTPEEAACGAAIAAADVHDSAAGMYDVPKQQKQKQKQKQKQQQQQHQQQPGLINVVHDSRSPRSLRMDVATAQYMAFVYALRRVFNRALAVARCIADDGDVGDFAHQYLVDHDDDVNGQELPHDLRQ